MISFFNHSISSYSVRKIISWAIWIESCNLVHDNYVIISCSQFSLIKIILQLNLYYILILFYLGNRTIIEAETQEHFDLKSNNNVHRASGCWTHAPPQVVQFWASDCLWGDQPRHWYFGYPRCVAWGGSICSLIHYNVMVRLEEYILLFFGVFLSYFTLSIFPINILVVLQVIDFLSFRLLIVKILLSMAVSYSPRCLVLW